MKKKEKTIYFVIGILIIILIIVLLYPYITPKKTGAPIFIGRADLSIYEVEEIEDGLRYLVSVQNKGEGDVVNFNYGYREGGRYVISGEYPLIREGEILTLIIRNTKGEPLQHFKVDIGRWDDGESDGFIKELNETNNVLKFCVDRDGDGYYKYGKDCIPEDCDDENFVVREC